MQGEWRVIALKHKGKDDSGVSFKGMRFAFSEDAYTLTPGSTTPAGSAGKPLLTGPYTVDDTKSPGHLDLPTPAGDSRRHIRAIYKIVDGGLHLCMGKDDRPTSFDTDGSENICYVLERVVTIAPARK